MGESIPEIDLSLLAGDSTKKEALQRIRNACQEWGFFQVINHGLDKGLVEQILECSQHFFRLPTEEKCRLVTPYSPIGFVNKSGASGIVDRKEHLLFFGPHNPSFNLNVWPVQLENFRSVVEKAMQEAANISKFLTGLVFESLGVTEDRTQGLYAETGDAFIMPYYPASPPDYEQEVVLGQHRDAGILTVLSQLNGVGSLQVLKDDKWIAVKALDNALVVNIGDAMQVWSNGRYKSVMHRVVKSELDRYSCAYFYTPSVKTEIAPLPEFTLKEPPKYRPYIMGEYLQLRFKNRNLANKDKEVTVEHYAI